MTVTEVDQHLTQKLLKALTELPAAYNQLHLFQLPGSKPSDTGSKQRHGTLSTRAPLVLEVLDLLDRRHKNDVEPTRDNYDLDRLAGNRRLGILPTLSQWVRLADGEMWDSGVQHSAPSDNSSVDTECSWLLHHLDWITEQPWLNEMAEDLTRMLKDAQRVVGVEKQAKYFCTKCGWPIQERDGGAWYSCTGCDQNWTRLELHRFAERKKPKTLAEIAKLTNISLKTLRSFADRGHLKVVARDGKANLYDLDAVALATMNLKYKRSSVRVA